MVHIAISKDGNCHGTVCGKQIIEIRDHMPLSHNNDEVCPGCKPTFFAFRMAASNGELPPTVRAFSAHAAEALAQGIALVAVTAI